ncbi:MAG: hypothetical protein ABFD84_01345 [Candidatus Polarisedimenticolia bacterium]|nr:hypothetical protein [bacterium]
MNADREPTTLNPEGGDGEPPATSGERPADVADSHDVKAEPTAVPPEGNDDAEWEAAMLGVSKGKRRLSIEMALVGFVGFPILVVVLFFVSFMSPYPNAVSFLSLAALMLTFIALLATRRRSLAVGGIAGIVTLYLLVRSSCGW